MSIRTEADELGNAIASLGQSFVDGDKEGASEIIGMAFEIIKEGADFAKIPKEERLKAVLLALDKAVSSVAEKAITFSDEKV